MLKAYIIILLNVNLEIQRINKYETRKGRKKKNKTNETNDRVH